jgi:hypothetical protein
MRRYPQPLAADRLTLDWGLHNSGVQEWYSLVGKRKPDMSSDDTGFLFSTPEMTEIFSLTFQLRAMMRFEWALSVALEKNGIA